MHTETPSGYIKVRNFLIGRHTKTCEVQPGDAIFMTAVCSQTALLLFYLFLLLFLSFFNCVILCLLKCRQFEHIGDNHLLQLCQRLGPLVDKEVPTNIRGVHSLLGAGRQSILRHKTGKEFI